MPDLSTTDPRAVPTKVSVPVGPSIEPRTCSGAHAAAARTAMEQHQETVFTIQCLLPTSSFHSTAGLSVHIGVPSHDCSRRPDLWDVRHKAGTGSQRKGLVMGVH